MEANLFVCIHKGTLLNWFLQQQNEPAGLLLSCDIHHRKAEKKLKIIIIIIKITISSIVIGLKNSYFPLIHLLSCYRTVCYRTVQQTNQIQSCSLNQPITFRVVV